MQSPHQTTQQQRTIQVQHQLNNLSISKDISTTIPLINNSNKQEQQSNQKQQPQQTHQQQQSLNKIQQLRTWMQQKGCIIHPSIQIPSFINGYQGVSTTSPIPPRTLIIAIPSSLILTVSKCYKDPILKSIFTKNDDLFDYQASDDAQFNVLCVFMMYHKLNIQSSPWRIYLQTIGEPQTAIDWHDSMLKGLNKSVIQQIIHIRIQCDKLRQQLSQYLSTTKQFSQYPLQLIKSTFDYCYRAVMTRCFGYYFGQASLIPVADLINHGCEVVDHQLVNVKYQKGIQFNQSYNEKSGKIDLGILGIKRGNSVGYPYREKFLIQNKLVENTLQQLTKLDRQRMNSIINEHNQKLFRQQQLDIQIQDLQFCSQDDSQDNDTDVDEQHQRQVQLQRLQLQQLQQIENFKKYYQQVRVETIKEVEDRFGEYQKHLLNEGKQQQGVIVDEKNKKQQQQGGQYQYSRNNMFVNEIVNTTTNNKQISQQIQSQTTQITIQQNNHTENITISNTTITSTQSNSNSNTQPSLFFDRDNTGKPIPNNTTLLSHSNNINNNNNNNNTHNNKAIVPIKLVEDSSSEQSQDDQQWGLLPQSYFTMSTGSAVSAHKQLFNSYGSRTNRFLLIWYGFCYRNNLFDSVSLRLHVQFHKALPKASSLVLDTYVGGQGLSFRKNEKQVVHGSEVSREFRLKSNKVCIKLLTFLRLYLLDYYKGKDLYKICVTIPSSIQFQLFVLRYYKQIILALYSRYQLGIINELKQQYDDVQTSASNKVKINFKIIYLEQQRRILDDNIETVDGLITVWQGIKEDQLKINVDKSHKPRQRFDKYFYKQLTIDQLKKTKHYLKIVKNNYPYVIYHHDQQSTKNQQQ